MAVGDGAHKARLNGDFCVYAYHGFIEFSA